MTPQEIERVARAWASIDGKADRFDACKADLAIEDVEGHYGGYMAEAEELLRRSGLHAQLADAEAAMAALVERAAADCLARSVDVANLPDDHYGDPRAYAAELLEDQHERILALAPDAGVKDLAELRAERDDLAAALDREEVAAKISTAGNVWRYWRDLAHETLDHCKQKIAEAKADRDRLAAELAEARKQVEGLREALEPFAKTGSLFTRDPDPRWEAVLFNAAAGDEYRILERHVRKAYAALAALPPPPGGDDEGEG